MPAATIVHRFCVPAPMAPPPKHTRHTRTLRPQFLSSTVTLGTGAGTASADDYSFPSSVEFAANEGSKSFTFAAVQDSEREGNETIEVRRQTKAQALLCHNCVYSPKRFSQPATRRSRASPQTCADQPALCNAPHSCSSNKLLPPLPPTTAAGFQIKIDSVSYGNAVDPYVITVTMIDNVLVRTRLWTSFCALAPRL